MGTVTSEHPLREWDWIVAEANAPSVLPAFVLGYELDPDDIGERPLAPSWLVDLAHQYGGYACLQTRIAGAFLPLAENRAMAKCDVAPFEAALRIMSDEYDADPAGIRRGLADFAALAQVRGTAGQALTTTERRSLEALVQTNFDVPALAESHEALLRFETVDLAAFSRFRARDFELSSMPTSQGMPVPTGTILFDAAAAERLVNLGRQLRHPSPPALFLVWYNSD